MSHYKDSNNKIYWIDSSEYENLLPAGSIQITDEEAAAINAHPPETPEQVMKRLDAAIEMHIQSVIESLGYRNIERLSVYVNSTNPTWKAEADAAPKWITAIWEYALQVQADVQTGNRDIPTEAELIAELPLFETFLQA